MEDEDEGKEQVCTQEDVAPAGDTPAEGETVTEETGGEAQETPQEAGQEHTTQADAEKAPEAETEAEAPPPEETAVAETVPEEEGAVEETQPPPSEEPQSTETPAESTPGEDTSPEEVAPPPPPPPPEDPQQTETPAESTPGEDTSPEEVAPPPPPPEETKQSDETPAETTALDNTAATPPAEDTAQGGEETPPEPEPPAEDEKETPPDAEVAATQETQNTQETQETKETQETAPPTEPSVTEAETAEEASPPPATDIPTPEATEEGTATGEAPSGPTDTAAPPNDEGEGGTQPPPPPEPQQTEPPAPPPGEDTSPEEVAPPPSPPPPEDPQQTETPAESTSPEEVAPPPPPPPEETPKEETDEMPENDSISESEKKDSNTLGETEETHIDGDIPPPYPERGDSGKKRTEGDSEQIIAERELRNAVKTKLRANADFERRRAEAAAALSEEVGTLRQKLINIDAQPDSASSRKDRIQTELSSKESTLKAVLSESPPETLSADEERIARGLHAEHTLMVNKQNTAAERQVDAAHARLRRESRTGRIETEEEDVRLLEEARVKSQKLSALREERDTALREKDKQIEMHTRKIDKFKEQRKKLTGQPFRDAGDTLLEMLDILEKTEDQRDVLHSDYDSRISDALLTHQEERVLRGHYARRQSTQPVKSGGGGGGGSSAKGCRVVALRSTASTALPPLKVSTRLLSPPKRKSLPLVDRGPKLDPLSQRNLTLRLHDQETTMRHERRTKADESQLVSVLAKVKKVVFDKPEEDMLVNRVFYESVQREAEISKKATAKWLTKPTTHRINTEQEKESNNRMYEGFENVFFFF